MPPLNLFLVVDETPFFHPEFVASFLDQTTDTIVGAARVLWTPPKGDPARYLKRHVHYLRASEIRRLAWHKLRADIRGLFGRKGASGRFYSVRSAFEWFGVAYFDVRNNINAPENLDRIRSYTPDVLISSQSQIFGRELLAIPKRCCINRHSALLPGYMGLLPIFHAYRCGETEVGVTVHIMNERIDAGTPLAQRRFACHPGDTVSDLYARSFEESTPALLEALDRIRRGEVDLTAGAAAQPPLSGQASRSKESYFSFPTKEQWKEFRARGGRFI